MTITEPGGTGTGAEATATVGANGVVTGITITNPGTGYKAATVTYRGRRHRRFGGCDGHTTGVVTGIVVTARGAGYTAPQVTLSGGGRPVAEIVGNLLIARAAASDGAATIFGVLPDCAPRRELESFLTFNQIGDAGKSFRAYVLRPTGVLEPIPGGLCQRPLDGAGADWRWHGGIVPGGA